MNILVVMQDAARKQLVLDAAKKGNHEVTELATFEEARRLFQEGGPETGFKAMFCDALANEDWRMMAALSVQQKVPIGILGLDKETAMEVLPLRGVYSIRDNQEMIEVHMEHILPGTIYEESPGRGREMLTGTHG